MCSPSFSFVPQFCAREELELSHDVLPDGIIKWVFAHLDRSGAGEISRRTLQLFLARRTSSHKSPPRTHAHAHESPRGSPRPSSSSERESDTEPLTTGSPVAAPPEFPTARSPVHRVGPIRVSSTAGRIGNADAMRFVHLRLNAAAAELGDWASVSFVLRAYGCMRTGEIGADGVRRVVRRQLRIPVRFSRPSA